MLPWSAVLSAAVMLGSVSARAETRDEKYFVNVDAEIDGKAVKFSCERIGMKANINFSDNFFPSAANKYRSYQVACNQSGTYGGASIKFNSSVNILKETIPPYDGTKTWESLDKTFTVRVADPKLGKEIQIHSFMNSEARNVRQHYKGKPVAKITEFKEVKEGDKVFHVIGGSITAEFDEKVIQGKKKGSKGKVNLTFRTKVKFVSDVGMKKK